MMNTRRRAVLIVALVAELGISWAQATQTSANLVWDLPVASAAPAEFDNFAWDGPVVRDDGVGDSPLVP